jgi:hypothetical protein
MNERLDERSGEWPLRPWIMASIGALAGLAFHFLTKHGFSELLVPWREAAATFVAIATLSFLITVERLRLPWSVLFAIAWGAVIALVGWFTARYNADPTIFEWPYLSGLFAVMLAAPLFQTARDQGRWNLPYEQLHSHAWADAVIGAASLAFTGIVFLLAWLIAGLFDLIGIEQVRKLLEHGWFSWSLSGFAFGASVGLLRERDRLLPMLQRLVRIVLAVLAPPLAVALAAFLASIPFTGLQKFWKSGVPATPLLLLAGAGAILLANTVFADNSEARSKSQVLRWSSLLLVVVILPLAAIAALSIGIRIGQYGWTPERMWGVVAVTVAIAYGLAGWYAIWRGRLNFDDPLRPLQTILALGVCGLALFLALPVLDFGAISAGSQLDRLKAGKVTPANFDWQAMAFKFGPAGRSKLEEIAAKGPANLRPMAQASLNAKSQWEVTPDKIVAGPPPADVTIYPPGTQIPSELRDLLLHGDKGEKGFCSDGGACRVYAQPDGLFVALMDGCANLPSSQRDDPEVRCVRTPRVYQQRNGKWTNIYETSLDAMRGFSFVKVKPNDSVQLKNESDAIDQGDIHIAPVEKHQLVVGGKPIGDPF